MEVRMEMHKTVSREEWLDARRTLLATSFGAIATTLSRVDNASG